jgi:hypothetical protein
MQRRTPWPSFKNVLMTVLAVQIKIVLAWIIFEI